MICLSLCVTPMGGHAFFMRASENFSRRASVGYAEVFLFEFIAM